MWLGKNLDLKVKIQKSKEYILFIEMKYFLNSMRKVWTTEVSTQMKNNAVKQSFCNHWNKCENIVLEYLTGEITIERLKDEFLTVYKFVKGLKNGLYKV